MNMQRRAFIKAGIAAGALALGASSFLTSCSTPNRRIDPADSPVPGLDKQRAAMLHFAALAPSGHNSQPWRVTAPDESSFIVGFDPGRTLPAVDPDNRELLLSIGTFIENLCLAAGNAGYDPEVIILSRSRTDPEVARITLHPATPKNYPLKRLEMRRTVKSGMQSREIKNSDVDKLSQPFGGRLFYFPAGTRHADCIAEGAIEAFRAQTWREEAQAELSRWVRFGNEESARHLDGITTAGMETGPLASWYINTFMSTEDVLSKTFREKGIDKTATQAREGGGWFIITSAGETVVDIVDTGRRFQRMALRAREHNLAIHPMTQQLEEEKAREQIARAHGPDIIPQFILRVGYLDRYPDPVSPRRPVNRFVVGS
jgi:nitroreductase